MAAASFAGAAALAVPLLGRGPLSALASASLTSIGDAYVSADSTAKNYATVNPLKASKSTYRALLKFDTSGIGAAAQVAAVDLLLYPPQSISSGGFQVHPQSTAWSESTVTWSNQPPWNTAVLATSGTVTGGTSLDISLPVSAVARGAETDLGLGYSVGGIPAQFESREDPAHPPQLVVSFAAPTASPTATPSATPTPTATPSPTSTPAPSPSPSATPTPSPVPAGPFCGLLAGPPATSKLMVIFEENKDFSAIFPNTGSTPDLQAFADGCALATNYWSLTHMSLANYLAATSGVAYNVAPWNADCSPSACPVAGENVFDLVGPSGWKSYQESMPANCALNSNALYVARHNPAAYYTDISGGVLGGGACAANDVPLGDTTSGALVTDVNGGTLPVFSEVSPNLLNDMHDGTVAQGDAWLGSWIPLIVAGPDYQSGRLTVAIVWDEGSGIGDAPSNVPAVFMNAYIRPHTVTSIYYTHYSLYQAALDVAGVSLRKRAGF